jgi:pimeloyl-ACP methyl ester carboxylesterase
VLNDAGPRIEAEGLMAIRSYVGLSGPFPDWAAATEHVRTIYAPSFPALSPSDFDGMARAAFIETGNGIVADHDPKLARQLALLDLDQPLPELWNAFEALSAVPLLVIRGEHSTLLTRETVDRMQSRHPDLAAVEVAGQGHAPLLESGDLPALIHALARRATIVPKHHAPD